MSHSRRRGQQQAGHPRIPVSRKAAAALRRGHPWLFREGSRTPTGEIVEILADGKVIGWGLADDGPIAVRMLGRGPAKDLRATVLDRVKRADAARLRLLPPQTDAYRVVHGAGDGLPGLVVDRYGELAVIRLYAKGWESWLDTIVEAVESLGWATSVFRRFGVSRVDGRDGGELLSGADFPEALVVEEGGMKMLVRPRVGQKTGLFLDQRTHRAQIREWSAGRVVANLFAYNGGFSVSAALGGAAHVTTVDLAPEAVEDARENFRLNGLDPDQHAFEVADVFKWKPSAPLDLLIVDPPSLTRGQRSDAAAARAYKGLHERLGPFVHRDGLLATASCTARLSLDDWRAAVAEGLADCGDWAWHHVSTEPVDHPVALAHREGRYLKFALLRRL
ncbi:MAG: class I SAM-dependent rRNA methyltransferase [Deltaproteobacteria bacterium]|nr:MAG: class I SAM-dependent rRNA methyltransferase [Deltaproteobacteria bacterium]